MGEIPELTTPCVLWTKATDKDGYGTTGKHRAHRLAYEQVHGPIPEGMLVMHKCDNPPCVNVNHLRLGTPRDNMRDKMVKGRHRVVRGSDHGQARLTEESVRLIRQSNKTSQALADELGVHIVTVSEARRGKTWRHVT